MSSASSFHFDDSLWPLLIIRVPKGPTPRELEAYLAKRLDYMKRREQHVILYDTRAIGVPSNTLNQRHLEWLREHDMLIRETLIGSSIIITSPLMRLTASTLLHFKPPTMPYYISASLTDAVRWAADLLQKAGHPIPAHRIHQHMGSVPPTGT
ncbi:hypothetical protein F0U60_03885 [Archangium minus]|uniref:STAS/SEC14 domain-containing protein n=1 Tax=Archangium minus TaxID=83450 RepID=A0ABY9WHR0_9BACT|nr:hypothetical protein F0U60_03885 [Archangium minus]